ncbi:hypothetical protein Hanom_Chr16g01513541 [Helianthus anomalus]
MDKLDLKKCLCQQTLGNCFTCLIVDLLQIIPCLAIMFYTLAIPVIIAKVLEMVNQLRY